jgi:GntR family transcriptional repressor for pyruvate dehydrogenase complex
VTKQAKVYQAIVEQIIRLIKGGNLKQDDRLPSERRLAETFKVSRHSVREAIRTLEGQGVLVSRLGAGTFVANAQVSLDDLLIRPLQREKAKLAEIFQFRRMIEPQIAAQAALKASAQDIAELTLILERHRKAGSYRRMVDLDQAFHIALARATQNGTLLRVVERLTDILSESRGNVSPNMDRQALSIAGHVRILRAVSNGDSSTALAAMKAHLYQVEAAAQKGESQR